MFEDDYCEWDMLDEDLHDTTNVKLKHTAEFTEFLGEETLGETLLPINNEPTSFHMYHDTPVYGIHYNYIEDEEQFIPLVAALKF